MTLDLADYIVNNILQEDTIFDCPEIYKKLKVRYDRADGKPWDEWTFPSSVDCDKLRLHEIDGTVQIFLGNRVFGNISKSSLLHCMRSGEGYEYIEQWKICHASSLRQLSGKQILTITEMLRKYGHENQ